MKNYFILCLCLFLILFAIYSCDKKTTNISDAKSPEQFLELYKKGITQKNSKQIFDLYYLEGSDSIAIEQAKIFSEDITQNILNIKEIKIEKFLNEKKMDVELASGKKYKLNINPVFLLKIYSTDKATGKFEIGQPVGIVNGNYYIAGWIPNNEHK
ncbi:hypothetical protein KA977_09785 [Candidatus Dependentiae bacterium]|nr:hypothetical protein [Candidatus Dependentiae bacterium]